MLEIVFDTETTGIEYSKGHRIIEIGCVEVNNYIPTGRTFQVYINPERIVPEEVTKNVHGITNEFLKDKPVFKDIVDDFLEFIGDKPLVAHNAIGFDIPFLNYELKNAGYPALKNKVIDTLVLANKLYSSNNSLDDLCKKYGVDNTMRTEHGALLDSELLAEVYMHLTGGKAPKLDIFTHVETIDHPYREPRNFSLSEEEEKSFATYMKGLDKIAKKSGNSQLWSEINSAYDSSK